MIYLIVKCNEINSWECDVVRDPLYLRDEKNIASIFLNKGYELYKILPSGNLSLFKPYDKKITRKDLTGIKI